MKVLNFIEQWNPENGSAKVHVFQSAGSYTIVQDRIVGSCTNLDIRIDEDIRDDDFPHGFLYDLV